MGFSHRPANSKKANTPWQRLGGILATRKTSPEADAKRSGWSGEKLPLLNDDHDPRTSSQASALNPWKLMSYTLFALLIALLSYGCILLWLPQDLTDIRGVQRDTALPVRDISYRVETISPSPHTISFSESELNEYLHRSCRMQQRGQLSFIAHPALLALKIHDGYAELIIARVIGSRMRHTVSVFLKFSYQEMEGSKRVRLHLEGKDKILGSFQQGGLIGHFPVPENYMQMILPTLEPILEIYPSLTKLVQQHHYLPVFQKNSSEHEGRLLLVPPPLPDSDPPSPHPSLSV